MQRVVSTKAIQTSGVKAEQDPSDLRDAEIELTDEKDGAWAEGKAPIVLITKFLGLLEDEETELAIELAQQILGFEPSNQLVTSLLKALHLKLVVDQQEHATDEGSGDDNSDDDSSDEESTDNEDDDDEHPDDAAAAEALATEHARDVEL
ncbi:hypothetical protein H257_07726 [Aphanomyces astaci]|uniref:Uncharacterized protein n=1 Tax=Aphanomyces astaci TaxID=112090 RepID=W4GI07_APHAT|nr:hypothetical protein H257_07726 [Aphanomyces astaci]ETV78936.1 hypothetical protein H257_07726 [Aphanomyces astaci]|eukprot:XP_009831655.1 hypothetical protein H257_07726 [Aphanomyces astaci]